MCTFKWYSKKSISHGKRGIFCASECFIWPLWCVGLSGCSIISCDSAASLKGCCQFNSLSTFQLLWNTFIICHSSLALSLLANLKPFLFSCEETKNFIMDVNLICTTLFCIDFASYKIAFLDASVMCQMGFLCFLKNYRLNKVNDVTGNEWSFCLPLWEFKWTKNIAVCH